MLASHPKGENGIMSPQKLRTIIQNTRSLRYYDFERIGNDTLQLVSGLFTNFSKARVQRCRILLKLFECYLQITDQKFIFPNAVDPKLDYTIDLFIGALCSNIFLNAKAAQRYGFIKLLIELLDALKISQFLSINIPSLAQEEIKKYSIRRIKLFESTTLHEEHIYYWRGWWTYSKANTKWFLQLHGVYKCYGREFTERLFNQIDTVFSGCAQSIPRGIHGFCRWLAISGYTIEQFNDPSSVQCLFEDYLKVYLADGYKSGNGRSIKSLIVCWRGFIVFAENHFIDSIFAEPFGKLISPQPVTISGNERRIKKTVGGIEVKEKLLTEIPLHVTDEKAFELLFYQIQKDVNHVVSVAERLADDLWRRYQQRKTLAKIGVIKTIKYETSLDEESRQWIIHKNNPHWLSNCAATFEHCGFSYDNNNDPIICSSSSLSRTHVAYELGLPTSYALLPYMVLLVAEHPRIVPSFLTDFELYNKQGKLSGFVKFDSTYILDGRKKRRGPNSAQQIITLTEKSVLLIEQVIAITDCVRTNMKNKGDDNWRYLFLSCNKGFYLTRMCSQYPKAKVSKNSFYQELAKETVDVKASHAEKLSARFELNALRASKAVLVYIETRSSKKMAEVLGHKKYSPKTISHYLPEPILDFFQSRWIRIFQQGLIVEAMKESPHLLNSTEFNTMDEFHEFMKNHALKTMPAHLENRPGQKERSFSNKTDEIIFNINSGILSLLLSLQYAVCNAKKKVCGTAAYWSEVTTHLVNHIENGSQHASNEEFKSYLKAARCQINPEKLEVIIYA